MVRASAPRAARTPSTSSGSPVNDTSVPPNLPAAGPSCQLPGAPGGPWPGQSIDPAGSAGGVREPQADLPLGTLRRVRGVHQVLPVGQREVAADRTGGGPAPVGGSDEGAYHLDRLVAGQDRGDQRTTGHELLQRRV